MARIETGTQLGHYIVENRLSEGQGGMAIVYLAHTEAKPGAHEGLVVLKVTRTPDRGAAGKLDLYYEALSNEVETLRRLKHPHIVHLLPVLIEARTTPYIARAIDIPGKPWYCVMEYLRGGSLATLLKQSTDDRLALATTVEIVYQIGLALDYIHLKGFAHLDLKPDNILFRQPVGPNERPEAVLIDFGIARREKQTGLPAGAAAYMAPERICSVKGDIPIPSDQRPADIYSMGVLLYRCITGKLPFPKRDKSTTTQVILKEEPIQLAQQLNMQHLPNIPPVLDDVIMHCLHRDPKKRPSITELLSALDEAVPNRHWVNVAAVSAPARLGSESLKTPETKTLNKLRTNQSGPAGTVGQNPSQRPPAILGGIAGALLGGAIGALLTWGYFGMPNPLQASSIPTVLVNPSWPTATLGPTGTPVPTSTPTLPRPTAAPDTVTPFPTFTPAAFETATTTPEATSQATGTSTPSR